MITIIDYGMGNLGSIKNMLNHIDVECKISTAIEEIKSAKKIILPGVGSFDAAMSKILSSGIKDVLDYKVLTEKTPLLGICLGMQLLTLASEEGDLPGLGWIDAQTLRFRFTKEQKLKVPHMGWNLTIPLRPSRLIEDLPEEPKFYFVHHYFVRVNNPDDSLMKTHHGFDFDSVIQKDNIYGAQFHPEKSHKFGMKILKNFSLI